MLIISLNIWLLRATNAFALCFYSSTCRILETVCAPACSQMSLNFRRGMHLKEMTMWLQIDNIHSPVCWNSDLLLFFRSTAPTGFWMEWTVTHDSRIIVHVLNTPIFFDTEWCAQVCAAAHRRRFKGAHLGPRGANSLNLI